MKIRRITALIVGVLILLSLTGCSKAAMDQAPGNGMAGDYISKEEGTVTDSSGTSSLPENRKLIQTVNMSVETENLDAVLQQIDSRIAQLNGYVQNSNVHNGSAYSGRRYRSASVTVRIPAKDLDAFVDKVAEISNIVSSQKTVEDITLGYVATESRMKALQAEESRLLALMEKAETLDELLTVEKRLTEVRTELEQVTSALRVYDNQVDYATIHLNIQEVTEFTEVTEPETVWQRIATGFTKGLKGVGQFLGNLFVFVVVSVPYLALIAVAALIVIFALRCSTRRSRKKREKQWEGKKDSQGETENNSKT